MPPDDRGPFGERDDDILALLSSLDHPVPPVSAAAIVALADARARARAARRRTALRWAAAVLLTAGAAGAAVAAPGSPVVGWVTALVTRIGGGRDRPAAPPEQSSASPRAMAGIAVPPGDGLAIVFTAPHPGGVARVSFGEGEVIVVEARPGAARFTSEPDRLLIEALGEADTFAIEIPRTAPRVELRAGGTRLLVAERGRVRPAIASDSAGGYHVSLPSTAAAPPPPP